MGATRPRPVQRGTAGADNAPRDLDRAVPAGGFPTPEPYKAKGTTQRHTTTKCRAVAEMVMMWNTS